MANKKNSLLTPWLWLIIASIIALVFLIVLTAFIQTSYLGARRLSPSPNNQADTFEDCLNQLEDFELCTDIYEQDLLNI